MKTFIAILALAAISLFGYKQEAESPEYPTLTTPRMCDLRLQSVPGYCYLLPKFVYSTSWERQLDKAANEEVRIRPSLSAGTNDAIFFPRDTKWFCNDLNTIFMNGLQKRKGGC